MEDNKELYDVTIIGGGPAGLFAAFYAGLREMKVKVIEAQDRLGGKVHVYPQKMIWDVGGMTPVTGSKLIEQMIEQGLTFDPTVELEQTITKMNKLDSQIFELETDQQKKHYSKTVVMAVGGGIIDPIKLDVDHASTFEDSNLFYSVQSLQDFKNKTILISGGGPSAVDWANELAPIAKKVLLIYRGDQLKGHEADVSKLTKNNVEYRTHTEITALLGDDQIREVTLLHNQTKQTEILSVDAVLVNHGYHRNHQLMNESGLRMDLKDNYFIKGNVLGESNIPGLYGAGDILSHDGKLHLIAGAFQDAANAVNGAKRYLDPEAQKVALVSSHNDRFKEKNKQYLYVK
ncbi:NAD(P)/FAD-dependent oxidoreductase [Gracilibacillus thailandensis]|uniref:Ferredoxin--NADP reductase n=1 Tax=Gracilibacillus thailandensis TaxID=563735 RepID=A0A6N7QXV7_9BACI|nr:NAD(P)/FAD-dependent oxidoreductase [Gracilibacillus thailandensis]MRI66868.1 NAD(P)-binding protein [Gracilibacillus thailandensis]